MCEYQELRGPGGRADNPCMERRRELKTEVEQGLYRPEPELVAQAMLRRRGVRALLTVRGLGPGDRIPPPAQPGRQAA